VVVSLLFVRCGLIGRLRRFLERDKRQPVLVRLAGVGAFALALLASRALLTAPVGRLAEAGADVLPGVGLALLTGAPLQWLVRRRPRTWTWIAAPAAAVLIPAAGWLPYALALGPATSSLSAGAVRSGLEALTRDAHVSAAIVQTGAPGFVADVAGGL